jgi:uncharacterized protein
MNATEPSVRSLPGVSDETNQLLCQSCALCCDGTLFGKVPLELAELPPMRNLGFDIMELLEQAYFPQPCAKLIECRCSVYEARPNNCRGYRCNVLRRLERGELDIEQATSLVQKAASLRSSMRPSPLSARSHSLSLSTPAHSFVKIEKPGLESSEFSCLDRQPEMQSMTLRRLLDEEFLTKKAEAESDAT